jgi:hypothetical protein
MEIECSSSQTIHGHAFSHLANMDSIANNECIFNPVNDVSLEELLLISVRHCTPSLQLFVGGLMSY